jgi:DNA repair protein RecN (Recombination protein N)
MLRDLSIKNFAIIDDLQMQFNSGLTIMSGETGAGKSIIINAVKFLLGARAAAKLIRSGAETAELEAFFDIPKNSAVARMMKTHGYEVDDGLIIRRIISKNDRHRVFINGSMATMQVLQTITENLASISSQHAHQSLLKEDNHLDILDEYGRHMDLRETVAGIYREIAPLLEQRSMLLALRDRQNEQRDLLQFQKAEIEAAQLALGEDEQLTAERRRLRNFQTLKQTIHQSVGLLYSAQDSVADQLGAIRHQMETAAAIDEDLQAPTERVAELGYQVEDIAEELRRYMRKLESDDHRLEEVEARLDTLTRLKRKYGDTLDDVVKKQETIQNALDDLENLNGQIEALDKRLEEDHKRLKAAAQRLHGRRKKVAENLAREMTKELAALHMPGTQFAVELSSLPADDRTPRYLVMDGHKVDERGMDRAAFLIAPNIGEQLKPLAAIASGGELSRVVLALKAILAVSGSLETLIFDEVDAGIGGGVAEIVGKKLNALAARHQVICITHLPQIAKFGRDHFRISKSVHKGRTRTTITPLNATERLEEVARMLGGIKITPTTLDHAREILQDT